MTNEVNTITILTPSVRDPCYGRFDSEKDIIGYSYFHANSAVHEALLPWYHLDLASVN